MNFKKKLKKELDENKKIVSENNSQPIISTNDTIMDKLIDTINSSEDMTTTNEKNTETLENDANSSTSED